MVWDITIVIVYTVMSAFYVWLYTRADLARRGSLAGARDRDVGADDGPRGAGEDA